MAVGIPGRMCRTGIFENEVIKAGSLCVCVQRVPV